MFERFRRRRAAPAEGVTATRDATGNGRTAPEPQYTAVGGRSEADGSYTDPVETRQTQTLPPREPAPAHDGDEPTAVRERAVPERGPAYAPAVGEVRERQRAEFGGTNWGSAFFGWLVALGLSALLVSLAGAAGAALGYTEANDIAGGDPETIGLAGGAALLAALMIAYFAGGYVAGRMSRFDGLRQGFATWLVGIVVMLALGGLGYLLGEEYNVFQGLDLPRIPVDEGDLTTAGLIALAAVLVGTLLAAIAGGKTGERYHVRVDRFGLERDGRI